MNTLIICTSVHHKNTRKIAEAIADAWVLFEREEDKQRKLFCD